MGHYVTVVTGDLPSSQAFPADRIQDSISHGQDSNTNVVDWIEPTFIPLTPVYIFVIQSCVSRPHSRSQEAHYYFTLPRIELTTKSWKFENIELSLTTNNSDVQGLVWKYCINN